MEGVESDVMALVVAEMHNQYALYVSEFEVDNLICDSKSIGVKVKQMYKDKKTLVSVMSKYVVTHGFNCRTKCSDKKKVIRLFFFVKKVMLLCFTFDKICEAYIIVLFC